jgi:4-diphosphocytidyl-2-C-methyl-D-erythritol kinase
VTEGWRLCPAKVNLYLKVLARREDGYHDLVTVMQPLTLADELRLTPGQGLSLECRHPEVPSGPRNLVWRAAEAFGAATGQVPQVHLELVKKIPVAAGLGGGSSDAAGTLLALNDRAGTPLSAEKLHELAAALGADVPFFLQRSPAVGRGIGTVLSPLDLPPYWYVLLNPGLAISTAWVYRNLDLKALAQTGAPLPAAWDGDHPEAWVANDLETVTLSRYPELRELLGELALAGARAQGMSGSGPTLFGLFLEAEAARAAARRLRQNFSGWITVTRGLTQAEGEATGRVKDEWSENF